MLPASSTDYTALLAGTDERWNAMSGDGAPVFITYTFATANFGTLFGNSADFGITDFGAFSTAQQADFKLALAEFESVAGVRFIEVSDPADASITVMNATTTQSGLAGVSNLPLIADQSALNFVDMSSNGVFAMTTGNTGAEDYSPGTQNFQTMLHELGHSMGLQHPNGDEDDANFDTSQTLMSYNSSGTTYSSLRPLDVEALQQIYGPATGPDGLTSSLDPSGTFTLTGTAGDDILIATDTPESVLSGGDGNDAMYGRDGNDTFTPGAGDATIDGGTGNDTLVLSGARADYDVTLSSSRREIILTGLGGGAVEGTVRAAQIDTVAFSDAPTVSMEDLFQDTLAKLPDLFANGGQAVASLSAGSTVDVTVNVYNFGGVASPATDVAVFLSTDGIYDIGDTRIGTASVGTLLPFNQPGGAASTVTVTLDLSTRYDIAAGDYRLIYVVDPDNTVVERFEIGESTPTGNEQVLPGTTTYFNNNFTPPTAPYDALVRQDLPGDVDALFASAIYTGTLAEVDATAFTFTSAGGTLKATFGGTGFNGSDTSQGTVTSLVFSVPGTINEQPADLPVLSFGGLYISRAALMPALAAAATGNDAPLQALLDLNILSYTGSVGADRFYGAALDDTLDGRAGNDTLEGRDGDDTLLGGEGDDYLDGGTGADSMTGGSGNDIYVVDAAGDIVVEAAGAGTDTVRTSLGAYTLGANVENLVLTGNGLNGGGNALNNVMTANLVYSSKLNGLDGDDRLIGGIGNDTLNGASGNDTVEGGAGNDLMTGDAGNDRLTGGAGIDTIFGGIGDDILDGGEADDLLFGDDGNDTILGGTGNDLLRGEAGDDLLEGGSGADTMRGGAGADVLLGQDGTDMMEGGADNDTMDGGTGNDSLFGGTGDDSLMGGDDDDFLFGENDADTLDGGAGADRLDGGNGNDSLIGGIGNDTLTGGNGNDTVNGGDGSDRLFGNAGEDSLSGGLDNDLIAGNDGNDTLDGGAGNDSLFGGTGDDSLMGGDGDDFLFGDSDNDILEGGAGADRLYGGEGNDTLTGGTGNDNLSGQQGSDILDGGTGNDTLFGGDGNDTVNGGDGSDRLFGNAGEDSLSGGLDNDLIAGNDGNDTLDGGAGNDSLFGGTGDDSLMGGDGDDVLSGENDDDTLDGGAGADRLDGGNGNDSLIGGIGNDTLTGGNGNDTVNGGDGSDRLAGNAGQDLLSGGLGNDLISGDGDNDTLDGGAGNDTLFGGTGDDVVTGGEDEDHIFGNDGNDALAGGAGVDRLYGGNGNDTLSGGADNDLISGGAGADTFVFQTGDGSDTITDFQAGIDIVDATAFSLSQAQMEAAVTQSGSSVLFTIGTDQLEFQNALEADVEAAIFLDQPLLT